jgi:aldehyde dehydrogenase (NAD+)
MKERRALMLDLARKVELNASDLAYIEALENGKPFEFAKFCIRTFDAEILRYYAGMIDKIQGDTIPMTGPYTTFTQKVPIGVCG